MMRKIKTNHDVMQSHVIQTRSTTTRDVMGDQIPLKNSKNIRRGHIVRAMRDINHIQYKPWEENVADTLRMVEGQHLDGANRYYDALCRVNFLLEEIRLRRTEFQSTLKEFEATNEELMATNEEFEAANEELQATTAELERASKYLLAIMNTMESILMTTDFKGSITEVNRSAELISGYSRKELIGQPLHKFFTDPELAQAVIIQVLAKGKLINGELAMSTKDGQALSVSYSATILRDDNENVTSVLFTARDITEQKQAESALRAASTYSRRLLNTSVDSLMVINPEGLITDVNLATETLTGHSRKHLIGTDFSGYFTEPEKARAGYTQVFQDGSVYDYELEIRHKDGQITPVMYNASVYRDESGKVIGVFAAARNVSKRKQAEEALRIREQAIKSSINAFAISDLDGKVTYINSSFRRMWGYDKEDEVIGKSIPGFLESEDDAIKITTALTEKGGWQGETLAKKKDGSNFLVEIFSSVITGDKGEPICITGSFMDITDRKKEEDMKKTLAKLEGSSKELEQFAHIASHDLQEPLRKVFAFSDRLKTKYKEVLSEEGSDYLDRIQNAAIRMQTLINRLLTYSLVTSQAQPFEPVDLAATAQLVVIDLEEHLRQTGGRVEISDMPTIDADPTQMRQLLQNLIDNGLKFRDKERAPVVKVYSKSLDKACQIIVEDNGIGFDEKYLDRIFTIFQRLESRENYEGTGVGLAICRRIVDHHNGSITAKSTPDHGAMFIVTLPIRQSKERL